MIDFIRVPREGGYNTRGQEVISTNQLAPRRLLSLMLLLRSIFFTFMLPGTVTVLIPFWILSSTTIQSFSIHPIRYLGVPLILIGAAGLLWCIWDFFSQGRGTLAPIDPPKHLVVRGFYRYVRNPMYVCVVTILTGEAIFFLSKSVLFEAGIFFFLAYMFVVFYEEPVLRGQFGESYDEYVRTVGRWIPRMKVS
jgi:protein-S-isoprenylcysteine O-methyltransferase Ste14